MPQSPYTFSFTKALHWCFWLIAAALTVVLLFLVFRNVPLTKLGHVLASARYSWIGVAVICYLTAFCIRAHRWGILLGIEHDPGPYRLRLAAVFIGFGSNQLLPANLGEFLRAAVIKRFTKISLGTVIGSIVTMRLFDGLIAFLFLFAIVFSPNLRLPLQGWPILSLALILLTSCVLFWTAAHSTNAITLTFRKLLTRLGFGYLSERLSAKIQSVLGGLTVLKSPIKTVFVMLDTIAIWSISGIAFWLVLLALEINDPGFPGALFIQSMESMATFIPSLPGHLGTFEAAIRLSLDLYDVPSESAVGYVLIMRMIISGSIIPPFIFSLARLGLRRSDLFARRS